MGRRQSQRKPAQLQCVPRQDNKNEKVGNRRDDWLKAGNKVITAPSDEELIIFLFFFSFFFFFLVNITDSGNATLICLDLFIYLFLAEIMLCKIKARILIFTPNFIMPNNKVEGLQTVCRVNGNSLLAEAATKAETQSQHPPSETQRFPTQVRCNTLAANLISFTAGQVTK